MTSNTTRYTVGRLQPAALMPLATINGVKLPPLSNLLAGTVLGAMTEGTAASAVHTLTLGGTVTGGTIRLVYGPDTTTAIVYNATPAVFAVNVQAAVDSVFGPGNTVVAGTGPFTVTFQNGLANLAVPAPTTLSGLTGTTPTAAVTVTTPGVQAGTVFNAYNAGNSDGTQVARCLLAYDTVTNARGLIVADRPAGHEAADSTPVYQTGPFFVVDLIGLDAAAVPMLGRIANATSVTAPNAILQMR